MTDCKHRNAKLQPLLFHLARKRTICWKRNSWDESRAEQFVCESPDGPRQRLARALGLCWHIVWQMADTWCVCHSPIVSVAAETVSLSRSFGERCVRLSHAVPLQAATVNTSSSLRSTPACTLPGSHQAPLTLSSAVSYLLQNEIPRQYFSQLTSPPSVDWSQGGTAVTMIGFNYPSISLMHCAGEPVGGCFYVLSGGGSLLNFFCPLLECFLPVVSFTASHTIVN